MIKVFFGVSSIAAAVVLSACSNVPLTTQKEPMAIDAALSRARFDMNCPAATATVLSKQLVESQVRPSRFGGVERAEFTIGVAGCDKRQTLVVICAADTDGCFAADGVR